MVKVITTYQCTVCHEVYASADQALTCEQVPVTQDDGLPEVGDLVRITEGQGCGDYAKVSKVHLLACVPAVARRYWHTPCVFVTLKYKGGELHRALHFDQFEHGERVNLGEVLHAAAA